jgi:hypothetical protein
LGGGLVASGRVDVLLLGGEEGFDFELFFASVDGEADDGA